jgi:N-acetyl sugar amidotransferase
MRLSLSSRAGNQIHACRRCLYTTLHPLGLVLDEEGICSGCRIHEEKDSLDWQARWKMLEDLVAPYRVSTGKAYDCIVPVTGANDSYYIIYLVKERLGLNPLLVTYNKYFNTPLGIRNLANLRIRFNCDILYQNVNPVSVKKITRTTLREFGSIYWSCIAGQTVFPVQTAVRYKVPLIIWGAHQGVEQVGMFSHENEVEMTRRYRKDHDLMGYEADDLLSIFDTLNEDDIWQYRYPEDSRLSEVGVKGIYLGNYVRWDPKGQHEEMVRMFDYQGARFSRTFDTYDHVDCYNYMNLHDLIKLYKHGFSKVTDHASREIRHGRLTRGEALILVRNHEQEAAEYSQLFLDWLGVKQRAMQFIMDQYRNPLFWDELSPGQWQFNGPSSKQDLSSYGEPVERGLVSNFSADDELSRGTIPKYITIGKGWP